MSYKKEKREHCDSVVKAQSLCYNKKTGFHNVKAAVLLGSALLRDVVCWYLNRQNKNWMAVQQKVSSFLLVRKPKPGLLFTLSNYSACIEKQGVVSLICELSCPIYLTSIA